MTREEPTADRLIPTYEKTTLRMSWNWGAKTSPVSRGQGAGVLLWMVQDCDGGGRRPGASG